MNEHDVGAAAELVGASLELVHPGGGPVTRVARARRNYTARELHEAADLAEQGVPRPGSPAVLEIRLAFLAGDFERSAALTAEVKELAPVLRRLARAAEKAERRAATNAAAATPTSSNA